MDSNGYTNNMNGNEYTNGTVANDADIVWDFSNPDFNNQARVNGPGPSGADNMSIGGNLGCNGMNGTVDTNGRIANGVLNNDLDGSSQNPFVQDTMLAHTPGRLDDGMHDMTVQSQNSSSQSSSVSLYAVLNNYAYYAGMGIDPSVIPALLVGDEMIAEFALNHPEGLDNYSATAGPPSQGVVVQSSSASAAASGQSSTNVRGHPSSASSSSQQSSPLEMALSPQQIRYLFAGSGNVPAKDYPRNFVRLQLCCKIQGVVRASLYLWDAAYHRELIRRSARPGSANLHLGARWVNYLLSNVLGYGYTYLGPEAENLRRGMGAVDADVIRVLVNTRGTFQDIRQRLLERPDVAAPARTLPFGTDPGWDTWTISVFLALGDCFHWTDCSRPSGQPTAPKDLNARALPIPPLVHVEMVLMCHDAQAKYGFPLEQI